MQIGNRDLVIRPVRLDDAQAIHEIRIQPRVVWGTLSLPSTTLEGVRQRLQSPEPNTHSYVAELGGKVVGMIGIHGKTGRKSHCAGIGMMVHDAYQGKGVGTALMAAAIDLADRWLGILRLELDVYPDNESAVKLYKKMGFVEEGIQGKAVFRDGEFVDLIMMARFRPEAF